MYKRDFGILMLSAFAVYYSLQHEGAFSFRKAWYHHLDEATALLEEADSLPAPVVADMNGDGQLEVILATHDAKIQVLTPRQPGRDGEGFAKAVTIAEVMLLPSQGGTSHRERRAVALATGYLDPPPSELVRPVRKQVLVVVTASWQVLCFDHNLKLLWENSIRGESPYHHASVREVAVHISNHTVQKGDRGLVVVGGSLHRGDLSHQAGLVDEGDVLEDELKLEAAEQLSARGRGLQEAEEGGAGALGVEEAARGVDASRHFSYHAWEGGRGGLRWKHEGMDFHRNTAELLEQTIPQHNYRLDAASLEGRHYGEVSCRNYRLSVLKAMPHRWTRRQDTTMKLAYFKHAREGQGAQKDRLGTRVSPGGGAAVPGAGGRAHGADPQNPVARVLGQVVNSALAGGRAPERGGGNDPASPAAAAAAPGPAGGPDGPANVLVAHLQEGIEAVHLYSGRAICKLHLPPNGLHVDLNGDGVLDHLQAVGGKPQAETHSDTGHRHLARCWATVTSGVPPREHLFNGSLCRHGGGWDWGGDGFGIPHFSGDLLAPLEVATPAALPIPGPHGHYRGEHLAVFSNSRGEVTAFNSHGDRVFQVQAGVSWTNTVGEEEGRRVAATLEALPLRTGAVPSVILAAGAHSAAVLSEHGHVLARLDLPAAPVLPLLVRDFNGDRLSDLVLVTRDAVYGYAQIHHPGGVPFSALVGCLLVAMAVVYFTQQAGPTRSRKGRSTDRAD